MAKIGIDISSHNGNINLSALKDQIDFVIIRVGYGTKGTIDTKFERNVNLCRELGIPVGFYWYSYALDVDGAKQEAESFLNTIEPYTPEYGCWFDMEDADGYKRKNGMPSDNELVDICYTFCEIVENAGYYSGIYASLSWFNDQLNSDKLDRFDKWIAQWPTSKGKQIGMGVDPDSKDGWSLWQFTDEGHLNGYKGDLDVNYAYHDFSNPVPTPAPAPEPEPTPSDEDYILELMVRTMLGEFGDGMDRIIALGDKYNEVQGSINHIFEADIDTLAQEVINGDYGDGDTRRILLADRYDDVQARVNQMINETPAPEITKGSTVRFIGTESYSGIHLASWTYNDVFNVIEVSGDRVVIGKGTQVTAAVNINDCGLLV